ncbi:hypothetical protein ABI279_20550 [Pseudomonas inefficax]
MPREGFEGQCGLGDSAGEGPVEAAKPGIQFAAGGQLEQYWRMLLQPGAMFQVPQALVLGGMKLQPAQQTRIGRRFGKHVQVCADNTRVQVALA